MNQNAVQGDRYRAKADHNDERQNGAAKCCVVFIIRHALLFRSGIVRGQPTGAREHRQTHVWDAVKSQLAWSCIEDLRIGITPVLHRALINASARLRFVVRFDAPVRRQVTS